MVEAGSVLNKRATWLFWISSLDGVNAC